MSTNSGAEAIEGDGGNTTVHYYYSSRWQILETRNGSNQATRQWAWGFRYVDEPIFMDVNRAPTHGNDCDPDVEEGGGNNDARYYYQQGRNWNVVAVLESDFPAAGGYAAGVAGRVAERYAYTPYGEFVVLRGDAGSGQLGNVLNSSYVGSPFAHQGLGWDAEKGSYQNRWREYPAFDQRFATRDPASYLEGPSLYSYLRATPVMYTDQTGQGVHACSGDDNGAQGQPGYNGVCGCAFPEGQEPPSGTTATCNGYGYCQANLGGDHERKTEPVRKCLIEHECEHCKQAGEKGCCDKGPNDPIPPMPLPQIGPIECAAYTREYSCYSSAQCNGDQQCERELTCELARATCHKTYYCPGEFYADQPRYKSCLNQAAAGPCRGIP